ncbi:hypothetical protein A2U01_0086166, partial [Trifolium medium]|nr:hypothetical protein [Trifolium medium]
QPISGKGGLVGDIERCELFQLFQWETRDFAEKFVEVNVEGFEVKGIKVGESFEDVTTC